MTTLFMTNMTINKENVCVRESGSRKKKIT